MSHARMTEVSKPPEYAEKESLMSTRALAIAEIPGNLTETNLLFGHD